MRYIYNTIILVLVALVITSCESGYKTINNGVYFSGSTNLSGENILVDENGGKTNLVIAIANATQSESLFKLVVDEEVLKEYNQKKETDYHILPSEFYELDPTVKIIEGDVESAKKSIIVEPYSKELEDSGLSYAIPLRVESVDGKVMPIGDESKYVIMLDKIVITKALLLKSGEGLKFKLKESTEADPIVLPSFTLELWFCSVGKGDGLFQSGYGEANHNEVWCTTFNWGTNDMPGVKMRNNYFNTGKSIKMKKWNHYALTFNGNTGASSIYIDGKLMTTRVTAPGEFNFKPLVSGCHTSHQWLGVREYRIWSVERSQAQITNNMQGVNPKSEGLIGYWKLNEGEGSSFSDYSGNSFEGYVEKGGTRVESLQWVDYRSDNENIIGK